MYNMRTTRPDWIASALAQSDAALRETFQACTGLVLTETQLEQAALPLARGGLGLRSAARHAQSAYLSSRTATRSLCRLIDPSFVWEGAVAGGALEAARVTFNSLVADDAKLSHESLAEDGATLQQKKLSCKIDCESASKLLAASPVVDQARLRAAAAPHSSAWLQAQPSTCLDQRMTHPEFVTGLHLWLGKARASVDSWCPKCDQVMDTRGFHAMSCMAGGDAVKVHNALRDFVFKFARAAGLNPEKEESNLLPDDPRRRPGDIFFAYWPQGNPVAMDFAVTSPVQQRIVLEAAQRQLAAATAYEDHKLTDRDTGERCRRFGLQLVPMVVESFGGWGNAAQKAFKVIVRCSAAKTGKSVSETSVQFYSGLSIHLMRANARAVLARVSVDGDGHAGQVDRSRSLLAATA